MIMYIYHSDSARSLPLNRGEPKDSVARKKEPCVRMEATIDWYFTTGWKSK